jgi:hypothetical protein
LESFGKKKKKSKKKITIQELEADEKEDAAKGGPFEEVSFFPRKPFANS